MMRIFYCVRRHWLLFLWRCRNAPWVPFRLETNGYFGEIRDVAAWVSALEHLKKHHGEEPSRFIYGCTSNDRHDRDPELLPDYGWRGEHIGGRDTLFAFF